MLYIIFKTLMGTGGQPGLKQTKTKNRLPTTKNQTNLGPKWIASHLLKLVHDVSPVT